MFKVFRAWGLGSSRFGALEVSGLGHLGCQGWGIAMS